MRRGRFKIAGTFKLQLTSLMDMFTIILVFLLVSFSSEDYDFVLEESLHLPRSTSQGTFRPAVNIVVGEDYIKVEENVVARLTKGEVSEQWSKEGRIEGVVRAVRRAKELRAAREGEEEIVVIQAEKSLPYKTVYLVMRSCSIAGYTRYRIAIEKE